MAADEVPVPALAERVREARVAFLLGALGLTSYLAFVWATQRLYGFDVERVAPIFTALILLNLALTATADRWVLRSWAAVVYGVFHALMLTVLLGFLGGTQVGILFTVYVFPVFHAAMLRAGLPVLVTANVGAGSYLGLALFEHGGSPPAQVFGLLVCGFLILNFLALYANHQERQLRRLASRLQQMVADRTAELTTANTELAAKARALEAKQEELRAFVYTVTHDLKNPLSAILLLADLVAQRDGGALSPEGREDLERVVRLAGVTEDMIRDLLGLFRITTAPEPDRWVDVDRLVAHALENLRPQIEAKGVRVRVGSLPRVWGQSEKLGQVMTNLLSNAVKYVPSGRGAIDVAGNLDNGTALIAVRDNGIGIPEEYQTRVFELFGRVPEEEQRVDGHPIGGTGVGLAMVKQIVERHGGTVELESSRSAGSCFLVRLPATTPAGAH